MKNSSGGLGLTSVPEKCQALLLKAAVQKQGTNTKADSFVDVPLESREHRCVQEKIRIYINTPQLPTTAAIYHDLLQSQGGQITAIQKMPNLKWNFIWKIFGVAAIPSEWRSFGYLFVIDAIAHGEKTTRHGISSFKISQNHQLYGCFCVPLVPSGGWRAVR